MKYCVFQQFFISILYFLVLLNISFHYLLELIVKLLRNRNSMMFDDTFSFSKYFIIFGGSDYQKFEIVAVPFVIEQLKTRRFDVKRFVWLNNLRFLLNI